MSTVHAPAPTTTRPHPGTSRVGGAAGLAFVALALIGNSLTGGGAAPDAPAQEFADEVVRRTGDAAWRTGLTLELLAFVAALVFAAALARRVRAAEPEASCSGSLVLAGGVLFVATKLASGSALYAADQRAGDMEPALARLLNDLNAAAFVLSFVPLAVLLGAAAVAALAHRALPRSLGWSGAVLAVLLLAAACTGAGAVPIPFLLALVWVVATSVVLLRRSAANAV